MGLFRRRRATTAPAVTIDYAASPRGVVAVDNTHLYLGATGALPPSEPAQSGDAVQVEFSDGVRAHGRLAPMAGGRRMLEVSAYKTLKGAAIGAKAWILSLDPEEPGRFRVRARMS